MDEKLVGGRSTGYLIFRRTVGPVALLLGLILALAAMLPNAPGNTLTAAPSLDPTYSSPFDDCVTGDNQFWQAGDAKFSWYVNQGGCDTYSVDRYERPTDQTFKFNTISQKPPYAGLPSGKPASPTYLSGLLADDEFGVGDSVFSTEAGLYFEFIDITRAWATSEEVSPSEGWMFFRTELFGDSEVDSDGKRVDKFGDGTYYTVRMANNPDPNKANGGIALRNQRETNITTSWSTTDAKVFFDTNGSVSSTGGVNVPRPPDSAGDGYDLDEGNNDWLYVRRVSVPFTGPGGAVSRPAVEFAFNYRKYNADKGRNFTPESVTYLEFDSTRGLKDNQNYLWNDEYTLEEAGSPNPNEISDNNGTQNVYQLDTLSGGFQQPTLKVTKTPDNGTVNAGEDVVFDITVDVGGAGTAKNVVIDDQLPAAGIGGWSFVAPNPCTNGAGAISGNTLNCKLGDLTAIDSKTITVKTGTAPGDTCRVYDNNAGVAPLLGAIASADNAASASDVGKVSCQQPTLKVTKTPDNGTVNAGEDVVFDITVDVGGAGTAKNVVIDDQLPAAGIGGWSFVAPNPCTNGAGAISGNTLNCKLGDLTAIDSKTITVKTGTAPGDTCRVYDNNAGVAPLLGAIASADNAASASDVGKVSCQQPTLKVTKTPDNGTVNAGEDVVFDITVDVGGAGTAKNVVIDDQLPAAGIGGWSFVAPNPCTNGAGAISGNTLNCKLGDLTAIDSKTITVKTGTAPGDTCRVYDNNAGVAPLLGAIASADNAASASDVGKVSCQQPTLKVTKTPDNGTVNAGEDVVFDITVDVGGAGTAKNVVIDDQLPAAGIGGWSFVAPNPCTNGAGAISGNTLNCKLGDLTAIDSKTITVKTGTAPGDTCRVYDNNAGVAPLLGAIASADNAASASDVGKVSCQQPTLKVTKTPDNGTVNAGEDVVFDITVDVGGAGTAKNVVIDDQLPAAGIGGWSFVAPNPCTNGAGAISGNTLNCKLGDLTAIDSKTITVKTGTAPGDTCRVYDNNAGVAPLLGAIASADNAASASDVGKVSCQQPTLKVTKTPDNGTVNAGEDVVFDITVDVGGAGTAKNVVIDDQLPAAGIGGWSFVAPNPCTNGAGAISGNTLNCKLGDLTAIDSKTITVKTGTAPGDTCRVYDNNAGVAPLLGAIASADNAASASDVGKVSCQQPTLKVTKTPDNGTVNAGEDVVFDITVTNNGPGTATGVTLSDPLPTGVVGESWTVSGTDSVDCEANPVVDGTLNCDFGPLAEDASRTVTLTAKTNFDNCKRYDNVATATSTNGGFDRDAGKITCEKPPVLVVDKTPDDQKIKAGDDVVFDITVTNNGPGTATGVTLSDPLPTGVVGESWTVSGTDSVDCEANPVVDGTLNCDFGPLAEDASRTVTLTAKTNFDNCKRYDNVATATSTNGGFDRDAGKITCEKPPVLVVDKTPDDQKIKAGDDVVFDITVTNNGPGTATGVTLSDPLPTGVVGESWTVSGTDSVDCEANPVVDGTLNCDFGPLAEDASRTVTLTAKTNFDNCKRYDNVATATSTNGGFDRDAGKITCEKPPVLVVDKTPDDQKIKAGDDVVFDITVTNNGPGTATGVTLSDPLPTGVVGESWTVSGTDSVDCEANPVVDGTLNCDFGPLAEDASRTVTLTAKTNFDNCKRYDNVATATSTNGGFDRDAGKITCEKPPVLVVDKTPDDQKIKAGDDVVFDITVTNNGPGTATGVTLSDPLPTGVVGESWTVSGTDSVDCEANPVVDGTLNCDFGPLAEDASRTVTLTAKTNFDNCKRYDNVATATSTNGGFDRDAGKITCEKPPVLVVDKTPDDQKIKAGDDVVFDITVTNNGPGTATGVTLSDPLPTGVVGESWTVSGTDSVDCEANPVVDGTLNCDFGPLAEDASRTVTLTAKTNFDNCKRYDNVATATSTNGGFDRDAGKITCEKPPVLVVDKTPDDQKIKAGDDVVFDITVTNNGPGTATGVTLSDPLPTGVVGESWTVSGTDSVDCEANPVVDGTLNCDFGPLAEDASRTVTLTAKTNFDNCKRYDNVATATSTNGGFDRDAGKITCEKPPVLVVDKTPDDQKIKAGDDVVFDITVTNNGPGTATGVTLSDPLPTGVVGESWTVSGTDSVDCEANPVVDGTLNCDFGPLAEDASRTVTLTAKTNFDNCKRYDNVATATSTNGGFDRDAGKITCEKPPVLVVDKTPDDQKIKAGDDVVFDITVTNNGPGTATGVTLSDPLPTGVVGESWTVSGTDSVDCEANPVVDGTLNCDFGPLAEDASRTVTLTAKTNFDNCKRYDNVATATSTNGGFDRDAGKITCEKPPVLVVDKTPDDQKIKAGDDVVFDITVTNNGPGTATGVTLSDPLPTGVVGESWTVSGTDSVDCEANPVVDGTLNCDFGPLAEDASRTVTLTAKTNFDNCKRYDNVATATSTNGGFDRDAGKITCEKPPVLVVDKTPDDQKIKAGDDVVFDITVTNNGPGTATGVTLSDPLPTGVVGESWTVSGTDSVDCEANPVVDGTLNCDFGPLAEDASRTVTLTAKTNFDNCKRYDNVATATSTNGGFDRDAGKITCEKPPVLVVDKTPDDQKIKAGDDVVFDITVTNNGPGTATGVTLSDPLPTGVVGESWTVSGTDSVDCEANPVVDGTLNCDFGPLAEDASRTVTLTAKTNFDNCKRYDNVATATSTNGGFDRDAGKITCEKPPVLVVDKTPDDQKIKAGDDVVFDITVTNNGPGTATGVTLSDPLPTGVVGESWTVSGTDSVDCEANPVVDGTLNCDFGPLAEDASRTVTLTAKTNFDNCKRYDNVATATSTNGGFDRDAGKITCEKPPVLVVDKTPDDQKIKAGDDVVFDITVTNNGPGTATGVTLSDPLPTGVVGESWTVSGTDSVDCEANPVVDGTLNCDFGPLAEDASRTVTLTAKTNFDNCKRYDNVATATSTNGGFDRDAGKITCEKPPVLVVDKTPDDQKIKAGDDVVFDITVTNNGPGTATGVTLSDPLPQGVAGDWGLVAPVTGCTIDTSDPQPDDLSCDFGDLAVGDSRTVSVKAATDFDNCKVYDNTATATATNALTVDDNGKITCEKPPVLVVDKTPDDQKIKAGDDVVFDITVTNNGPGTATGVTLSDPLPQGVAGDWGLVAPVTGCTIDTSDPQPDDLSCDFGDLAVGDSRTVSVKAATDFDNCKVYDNTATATATNALTVDDNGKITCEKPPVLVVDKTPDDQKIKAGDDVVFDITVTNNGPGTATGVTLSDPLPQGVAGDWGLVAPVTGCTIDTSDPQPDDLSCDFGDLAVGDSRTVSVKAATDFDNCKVYDNTATATATNALTVDDNGKITCEKPPVLVVDKTPDDQKIKAGDDVVFDITVTNNGPGTATGVTLSDPLPQGVAGDWGLVAPVTGCTIDTSDPQPDDLSCDFGDLAVGDSRTVSVKAATDFDNCKVYDNTATATATNALTVDDNGKITCEKPPVLVVDKTPDDQKIKAGDDVVFDITVTNNGPGTATGVTLSDPLPQGVAGDWGLVAPVTGCTIDTSDPQPDDLSCDFGDLAVGDSRTVSVKAATDFDNCKVYDNTATATATNALTVDDNGKITCEKPPVLVVDKTPDDQKIKAGDDVVFDITVTNNGPGTATGVTLSDPLPQGVAGDWGLVAPVTGCTIDTSDPQPDDLSCDFGDLAVGDSRTVSVKAATDFDNCKVYDNTATATATNALTVDDNGKITCEKPPVLVVDKTPDDQKIKAGDDVVFDITVTNNGPGTATGVTLSDPLPQGVAGDWGLVAPVTGCTIDTSDPQPDDLSCDFGDLAVGDSRTVSVKAATDFDNCKVYDNTATATATNALTVDDNGKITCEKPPVLVVEKSGNGPIDAGQDVVFTIKVTNNGPGVARSTRLQDSLPGGTAGPWAITTQPGGAPCTISSGSELSCDFGDLQPGQTVTVRVKAPTSRERCKRYDNTATAIADNALEVQDDATVRCDKPPKPRLTLTKKANKKRVKPGGRVNYTIIVKNTRKDTVAKNLKICDRIPRLMTVVSRGGGFFQKGKLCWKISKLPFSKSGKSRSYVTRVANNAKPGTKLRNVVTLGKLKDTKTVKVKPGPNTKFKATPVTG